MMAIMIIIVFDGTIHNIVELSGVEYPGIIAKVELLEHRVEPTLDGELGECITKHFAMRVGKSELPTCIRHFLMVLLFFSSHVLELLVKRTTLKSCVWS